MSAPGGLLPNFGQGGGNGGVVSPNSSGVSAMRLMKGNKEVALKHVSIQEESNEVEESAAIGAAEAGKSVAKSALNDNVAPSTQDSTGKKDKSKKKEIPPEYANKIFEKKQKLPAAEYKALKDAEKAKQALASGVVSKPVAKEKIKEKPGLPPVPFSPKSKSAGIPSASSLISRQSVTLQHDDEKKMAKQLKQAVIHRVELPLSKQIGSFTHLPQYLRIHSNLMDSKLGIAVEEVHPSFLQLGLKFEKEVLTGATARCMALLEALKDLVADYVCPFDKVFGPELISCMNRCGLRFIVNCRPLTIGMKNSITWLKKQINELDPDLPHEKARDKLLRSIEQFVIDRIVDCDVGIVQSAADKVVQNDVILTYGHSHLVENLLKKCHSVGKKFKVIVCDGRPKLEGKELARRLVEYGLDVTYILINALAYTMPIVTRVFLGASAILSNGAVVSRVGTSVVAMMAHTFNRPVLLCCQTFKFSERVQLDSICSNELGDPHDLIFGYDEFSNWAALSDDYANPGPPSSIVIANGDPFTNSLNTLKILNLLYDLTPAKFVSIVITEVGLIPPTSVPVVIREYRKELY